MLAKKGKNQQYVKEKNRALILKLICTGACTSRVEIAKNTGLSKMTVTNIINELINLGIIYEGTATDISTVGRKPIMLLTNEDSIYSLGIYISRDNIVFSLLTLKAKILKHISIPIDDQENSNSLCEKILNGINNILNHIDRKERVYGIGVACIGPLDIKNGIIINPTDFHDIKHLNIKRLIENHTGLFVTVNNDMNAAALAEQLYGKGKDKKNFIYLGITNGIGSGIITNGYLYTGEEGYGGELGHTTINFDGPLCSCGNKGCLEAYASIPVIICKASEYFQKDITFPQIIEAAKNNEPFCKKLIDSMCEYISIALINTVNILDCSSVFLGHEAAQGGDYMTAKIEQHVNTGLLIKSSKQVNVENSEFDDNSPIIGSGVLVFDKIFSGELPLY